MTISTLAATSDIIDISSTQNPSIDRITSRTNSSNISRTQSGKVGALKLEGPVGQCPAICQAARHRPTLLDFARQAQMVVKLPKFCMNFFVTGLSGDESGGPALHDSA